MVRLVASISFVDGNLNIRVPSQFFVEQLEERYFKLISKTLHKVYYRR